MTKFRYPIIPDRTYTLEYDSLTYEVSGEEILAMFRREAMLDKLLSELDDDLNTPEK